MKRLLAATLVFLLAACASVGQVDPGERAIGERMQVKLDGAWNLVATAPAQVWTMEGAPVDRLLIYSGIKDGESISGDGREIVFRSGLQGKALIPLFEKYLTDAGSTFTLGTVEPARFGGNGVRFEYSLARVRDGFTLRGIGYAAVSRGELFAILYVAPRLVFFDRYKDRVESLARSAVIL